MMIKKLDKKSRLLIEVIIFSLFISIITTSWAYFTMASVTQGKQNIVNTGNMEVTFVDGDKVFKDEMIPGDSITKTFKVKNTGTIDTYYDVYFSEVLNSFADKDDLVYTIVSANGCSMINETTVPSESGVRMVNQCLIEKGVEHTYTLKITFKETNDNQNDNQGKEFSAKISVNDYESPFLASNVAELRTTDAEVGKYIFTSGYYSENDGGQSRYIVEEKKDQTIDDGRYIELNNGNVAKLLIESRSIDVRQYGAKGDGESDDSEIIQNVFNQLKEDDLDTITFAKGTYVVTKSIKMPSGNYIGKEESKVLIKGTDVTSWGDRIAFQQDGSGQKIIVNNMNFEIDMQTDGGLHMFVLRFSSTHDSKVLNTKFVTAEGNTYGVCAIDLYANNDNFEIDHMYSRLYAKEDSLTTHVAIRDVGSGRGYSSNIKVTNLDGAKNGKDESIWVGWEGDVKNVEIANSKFVDEGVAAVTFLFAGTTAGAVVDNISFHDNEIIKENFNFKLISIGTVYNTENYGATAKNIHVYNNTIQVNSALDTSGTGATYLVLVGDNKENNKTHENILIEDNTFIAETAKIGTGIANLSEYKVAIAKNNVFKINSINSNRYNGIYAGLKEVSGGSITKTDGSPFSANFILRNNRYVHDLTIENGSSSGMIVQDFGLKEDSLYRNCNFKANGSVFMFTLNSYVGQNITIEDSTVSTSHGAMFNAYYQDLNSATSTNKAVNITIRNSVFNKYNTYGTINVIRE